MICGRPRQFCGGPFSDIVFRTSSTGRSPTERNSAGIRTRRYGPLQRVEAPLFVIVSLIAPAVRGPVPRRHSLVLPTLPHFSLCDGCKLTPLPSQSAVSYSFSQYLLLPHSKLSMILTRFFPFPRSRWRIFASGHSPIFPCLIWTLPLCPPVSVASPNVVF